MTRRNVVAQQNLSNPLAKSISRRDLLLLAGTTSLLGLLGGARGVSRRPQTPARQPNIIYMHSHDTGRYIAPYGYAVSTPHLQQFADEGMVFTQAFSASPTCSPSRASLMTGMTPGSNGMWGLAHLGHTLNDYGQGLVPFLRRAGYTSALVGVQHIASGRPEACAKLIGYDALVPTRGSRAAAVAEAAVGFLEQPPKEPFFLDIGFSETHVFKGRGESRFGYTPGDPARAIIPPALMDTPETRCDMADYSVALEALDAGMGQVLEALARNDLAADTLVIITTDHGIPLPGMKANHTDNGLGVMLMLRGPGGFLGGKTSDALVSQIDIFPTLCEVLGLEPPAWLQGRSLTPLVTGEATEINEAIYAEHEAHAVREPQASVRTARYRYVRRLDGNGTVKPQNTDDTLTKALWLREGWVEEPLACEGLFNLERDPEERHNLVNDVLYREVLSELRSLMVARMARFENPLLSRYRVASAPPERQG